MLPERSHEAEEAFVLSLQGADAPDLREAAMAAIDAGRIQLAARLVGLIEDDGDPDLERARRAARFLLTQRDPAMEDELVLLMSRLHKRRRQRFRRRHMQKTPGAPKPTKWKGR